MNDPPNHVASRTTRYGGRGGGGGGGGGGESGNGWGGGLYSKVLLCVIYGILLSVIVRYTS